MAVPAMIPKLAFLALAMLLVGSPEGVESAIPCNQVVNYLTPCLNYVMNGGQVPAPCCKGVQNVYAAAQTTPDRQGVCSCLKSVVSGYPISNAAANNAAGLPAKCGINLPYKISPSTDCKR